MESDYSRDNVQQPADVMDRKTEDEFQATQERLHHEALQEMADMKRERDSLPESWESSFDMTTRKGKAMFLNARAPGELRLRGDGEVTMRLTDWCCFEDEVLERKTGEMVRVIRSVLFDTTGDTFRTTSPYIKPLLKDMQKLFSKEEWKAGILITIQKRQSDQPDRQYHSIYIHDE